MTREEFENLPADYYDARDVEELSHDSIAEAVEDVVDSWCERDCDVSEVIRECAPIAVTAFRRGEVTDTWIARESDILMEILAEHWVEEYGGNPDGDEPESAPGDTMLATIRAFVAKQKVFPCVRAGEYTYSAEEVEAMMRKHNPHWFEAANG